MPNFKFSSNIEEIDKLLTERKNTIPKTMAQVYSLGDSVPISNKEELFTADMQRHCVNNFYTGNVDLEFLVEHIVNQVSAQSLKQFMAELSDIFAANKLILSAKEFPGETDKSPDYQLRRKINYSNINFNRNEHAEIGFTSPEIRDVIIHLRESDIAHKPQSKILMEGIRVYMKLFNVIVLYEKDFVLKWYIGHHLRGLADSEDYRKVDLYLHSLVRNLGHFYSKVCSVAVDAYVHASVDNEADFIDMESIEPLFGIGVSYRMIDSGFNYTNIDVMSCENVFNKYINRHEYDLFISQVRSDPELMELYKDELNMDFQDFVFSFRNYKVDLQIAKNWWEYCSTNSLKYLQYLKLGHTLDLDSGSTDKKSEQNLEPTWENIYRAELEDIIFGQMDKTNVNRRWNDGKNENVARNKNKDDRMRMKQQESNIQIEQKHRKFPTFDL